MAAPDVVITSPRDPVDLADVRALFEEYASSLGFSLAYQGFEAELSGLPGEYSLPGGALLLARADGAAAGAVALRRSAAGIAEMKRLYVRPAWRRLRVGRALVVAIVERARALGYRELRLDTVASQMDAAIRLYRELGFADVAPYYPSPVPGTVYLALRLPDGD